MSNILTGLKYTFPYSEIDTEEKLLDVFSGLRESFVEFSSNGFRTFKGDEEITDFRRLLEIAISESSNILVKGSGQIMGLSLNDATLEYDLSEISDSVRYWDISRDGDCHSCHSQYRVPTAQDDGYWACKLHNPLIWSGCPDYDAYKKNSEGKPARILAELIEEASEF